MGGESLPPALTRCYGNNPSEEVPGAAGAAVPQTPAHALRPVGPRRAPGSEAPNARLARTSAGPVGGGSFGGCLGSLSNRRRAGAAGRKVCGGRGQGVGSWPALPPGSPGALTPWRGGAHPQWVCGLPCGERGSQGRGSLGSGRAAGARQRSPALARGQRCTSAWGHQGQSLLSSPQVQRRRRAGWVRGSVSRGRSPAQP